MTAPITPTHQHVNVNVQDGTDAAAIPSFAAAAWPTNLDAAVTAYERYHGELASRELSGTDPVLFPIRAQVRPSLESLPAVFDAQLATVRNAARRPGPTAHEYQELELPGSWLFGVENDPEHPRHAEAVALRKEISQRGTLTEHGRKAAEGTIAANKRAAIDTAVTSIVGELDQAEAKVRAQQASTRIKPKTEDINSAVSLAGQLEHLSPKHGSAILAEYITDLALAKNAHGAAAILPMLKSMFDDPKSGWAQDEGLHLLIQRAERLTSTWQGTVTAARLERIAKTRVDLSEYIGMLTDPAYEGMSLVDNEGNHRLFPEQAAPTDRLGDAQRLIEAKRATSIRIGGPTPEQRERDRQARRAMIAAAEQGDE